MPRRHTSCAARPAMSPPSKRIEPALGGKVPAIRLKIVVLPEPFGPMRPRISPGLTAKDTPLTARNPPNRFARPATSSTLAPVPHVLFSPYPARRSLRGRALSRAAPVLSIATAQTLRPITRRADTAPPHHD